MKYQRIKKWFSIFIILLFYSCEFTSNLSIRVVFEHNYGGSLLIEVLVENYQGFSLNGADVIVIDSNNQASLLEYDSTICRYVTTLSSPAEGPYYIQVRSSVINEDYSIEIPFIPIEEKPVISDIGDSSGQSTISGDSLDSTKSILVTLASDIEDVIYILYIYNSESLIYSTSSIDSNISIPEGTLSTDSYSAVIEVQSLYGDPLLTEYNYYSVSSSVSSIFLFSVE